jgi:enamine deaminase RidA (YjgF/YER057c/UK114 family)
VTVEDGDLVGAGDLATQAGQVFANVGRALRAVGARPDQVAKITIYVVGYRREYLPVIEEARVAVQTLSRPEYLIEVDAFAVV